MKLFLIIIIIAFFPKKDVYEIDIIKFTLKIIIIQVTETKN